jgi:hypothetical protein
MVLVGLLAVSAMGQQVFIGTDSNDLSDSNNWSPNGYPYQSAITIDNNDPYFTLTDSKGYALASSITLDRTGGMHLDQAFDGYYQLAGGVTVQNAATYTIDTLNAWNGPVPITYSVVQGAVLNIGKTDFTGPVTLAGTGTINVGNMLSYSSDPALTLDFTAATTLGMSNGQYYGPNVIPGVTGAAGTLKMTGGEWGLVAANYTFGGQLVVGAADHCLVKFVNADGSLASTVTNANVYLAGRGSANALVVGGGNQTMINSTIGGDGNIFCNTSTSWSGQWGVYNPATTLTMQGGSIAPSNSGVASTDVYGSSAPNGQMVLYGNLVMAKNAGKNTQFVAAVTGSGGRVGTDYTQLSIQDPVYNGGNGTINSASNIAASGTNYLADGNLVVNITPGLTPKNTLPGQAGDPFANETLTILSVSGTDLSSSSFANVKVVGGTATVGYSNGAVTLSNIFSNPTLAGDINNDGLVDVADYNIWAANVGKTGASWLQGDLNGDGLVDVADYNIWAANVGKTSATPEPISMIILAIGGGMVALKRRSA